MKRLLFALTIAGALIGCKSYPIDLSTSDEVLFKGSKPKLRLLTSLYKPYRVYKKYVTESIVALEIIYPSTIGGKQLNLSGTMLIPKTSKRLLPILVYCHGTMFDQSLAPSKWSSSIQVQALPAMDGYITFIPDYPGYGESQDQIPTYFMQDETVQSILDMIQYGISFLDTKGASYQKELYIMGYSQGGHAAISVQKQLEELNPFDLELKASVSIAGPLQLKENVDFILQKESFYATAYISYLFTCFNYYDWKRDETEFFTLENSQLINDYVQGRIDLNTMAIKQSTAINQLMDSVFLSKYLSNEENAIKQSLASNSNFMFAPRTPTLLVHSKSDEVVPFETSYQTWKNMIALGADSNRVAHRKLELESHEESAFVGIPLGLDFFRSVRELPE